MCHPYATCAYRFLSITPCAVYPLVGRATGPATGESLRSVAAAARFTFVHRSYLAQASLDSTGRGYGYAAMLMVPGPGVVAREVSLSGVQVFGDHHDETVADGDLLDRPVAAQHAPAQPAVRPLEHRHPPTMGTVCR
jgi:hypothetical protein